MVPYLIISVCKDWIRTLVFSRELNNGISITHRKLDMIYLQLFIGQCDNKLYIVSQCLKEPYLNLKL